MKRVLILANNDIGLYKFRKELIQELLRDNEVWISLPYGELVEPLKDMGCHFINTDVDRRGVNPKTDLKLLWQYKKLIKKLNPDKVITYTIKPNIYGGVVCRWLRKPYFINITGLGTAFQTEGMLKKIITVMYRFVCKRAKKVFFENKGNCCVMLENRIVKKSQAVLLPGAGVNVDEYQFEEYPDTENGYRFLFIGRIMQEKGIDELFEAAKRIRKERQDVFFDIVGPYEDDYKSVVEKAEQENVITFHGYQEDVRPFIKACHCFVLPSWHEGMANTLLESASMGRPLITSDIHGCKEAVEENKNGLLCSVKDSEELYKAIKRFLELDDTEKANWGRNSRERMEKIFDKRKVVEKTISSMKK